MAKITLNPLVGSFASVTALNSLFQLIEGEFNSLVLYRDNPVAEPNAMANDLDMAFNGILNLPAPVNDNDPVRLQDLLGLSVPLSSASAALVTISDSGAYFTSANVEGALQEIGAGKADKAILASAVNGEGASTVGIEDVKGYFTATTVEDALEEIFDKMFPLGSYRLGGGDPTGVLPGTWVQVPEGTFLMATVSGSDPSGGVNAQTLTDGQMPNHNHGGGAHTHSYWSAWNGSEVFGSGADIGIMGNGVLGDRLQNYARQSNSGSASATITPAGNDESFENRPLYAGIDVWQRVG